MTYEEKAIIDEYEVKAERRGVYKFLESDGSWGGKYCLVVSGSHRVSDRIISILILNEYGDGSVVGSDVVCIRIEGFGLYYVRCGLVTYCKRNRLGEMVHKMSKNSMRKINEQILIELGLKNNPRFSAVDDEPDYEKLYKDLLSSVEFK